MPVGSRPDMVEIHIRQAHKGRSRDLDDRGARPEAHPAEPVGSAGHSELEYSERLTALAASIGRRQIEVLAWRDLDDPEAGGSELHADELLRRWSAAGLDVVLRTSAVGGHPREITRSGYRVQRRSGRYALFPRVAAEMALGRKPGAIVEIWNGMPFFSPVWARGVPKAVFLHHVHAEMWQMVLPPALARLGRAIEERVAPRCYRRTQVVTLSESSRAEIVSMLSLPPENVLVASPGVGDRFTPGGDKAPYPLVVAVGRLVPVKRLELFLETITALRAAHPDLQAVLVGEGYERPRLEEAIRALAAAGYVKLAGRLGQDELVELYRRAWLLVSTSAREGWGMTITEAAACGTPAVATDIAGHRDAIEDGVTGVLAADVRDVGPAIGRLLEDEDLRMRLGKAAKKRAASYSWDATALRTLDVLAVEIGRSGRGRQRRDVWE